MLDIVIGGCIYGFVGHHLYKITTNQNDKSMNYIVISFFFVCGCYKVHSIKHNVL